MIESLKTGALMFCLLLTASIALAANDDPGSFDSLLARHYEALTGQGIRQVVTASSEGHTAALVQTKAVEPLQEASWFLNLKPQWAKLFLAVASQGRWSEVEIPDDPKYGANVFESSALLTWLRAPEGALWLSLEFQRGSPSENGPPEFRLYNLSSSQLRLAIKGDGWQNVDFWPSANALRIIVSQSTLTFCDVCPRWQDALGLDRLVIPHTLLIKGNEAELECPLSRAARQGLMERFAKLRKRNLKKVFWSQEYAQHFVGHLTQEFKSLLNP